MLLILSVTIAAFILNLPFGYLRSTRKKLSFMWLFYIHAPIPFIFVLRTIGGISYKFIPVILCGAVMGQLLGGRINKDRVS